MKKHSLDKSRIKVLLMEGIHENAVNYFRENGYSDIECIKEALSGSALEEKLMQAHIVGIRSRTELRGEILRKAPRLFTIGCFSIGTNQVALDEAARAGVFADRAAPSGFARRAAGAAALRDRGDRPAVLRVAISIPPWVSRSSAPARLSPDSPRPGAGGQTGLPAN